MKVFVTGGTGFIGSHLVMRLIQEEFEVTVLSRAINTPLAGFPRVKVLAGDLRDQCSLVTAMAGHDACIHNALVWGDADEDLLLEDLHASVNVFSAAEGAGVRSLIYTSSTAVNRPFRKLVEPEDPLTPVDPYAATKAAGETYLWMFSHRTAMRCNVVRPGPTVGPPAFPGAPVKVYGQIREIVDRVKAGAEVSVRAGEARQFSSVRDLANLYLAILSSEVRGEVFFGVSDDPIRWETVAARAIELAGSSSAVRIEKAVDRSPKFNTRKNFEKLRLRSDANLALDEHLEHLLRFG